MAPRIRFVRGPRGHRLAAAVDGSGPPLVLPAWWVSHVERDWAQPGLRDFFRALAAQHTVVRYDRAGVGLSDRGRDSYQLDDEVEDLLAVIEGLHLGRSSLLAISCGAPPAIALAVRRPELVERLIVFGGYLRGPAIGRPEVQQALVALVRASWGLGSRALCDIFLPGASPEAAEQFAESQRHGASAETSARLLELTYQMDVSALAPAVTQPTLVLHRRDDRAIRFEHGREVAAAIPGAELHALDGNEHLPWAGDTTAVLAALGVGAAPPPVAELSFRRDGDVWTIVFRGRTVHAKHARGLADLATLVAHPGHGFHAVELMHGGDGPAPLTRAGAVLDDKARAAYQARLDAIADDPDHQAEREAILDELRAATGLGGRARPLGDDGERARKAVTARIRDSIARLRQLDAELGAHLDESVETGLTCSYAP